MTVEDKNKIIEMRNKGLGYTQISNTLGISKNTIKSFCQRHLHNSSEPENSDVCRQCGKDLLSKKNKKFCSNKCRYDWWNQNRVNTTVCTCAYCGSEFQSYGNKNRKYCRHSCFVAHRFNKGESL